MDDDLNNTHCAFCKGEEVSEKPVVAWLNVGICEECCYILYNKIKILRKYGCKNLSDDDSEWLDRLYRDKSKKYHEKLDKMANIY